MSSDTPQTDLWLERSRLAGMILAAVSYGGFFILTVQAVSALMQRPRNGGKIAENRLWLLFYVIITFALGTVGFAANVKYTEMIWIDLRDIQGGPVWLIEHELHYSMNIVAIASYYAMEGFMQLLLLHRCCVVWNWSRYVVTPMVTLFLAMTALSTIVLVQGSTGLVWYHINTVLINLCFNKGFTLMYTILMTKRLLAMRSEIKQFMGESAGIYNTVVLMIIESTALYIPFGIVFIFAFAFHSNISNLFFLDISLVQGIAQLLIITRVARGRSITHSWSSGHVVAPSSVAFVGTTLDPTETTNLEPAAKPGQDGVQLHLVMAEVV